MVILRSGSTTESDFTNMTEPVTSDQFALVFIEACKRPDIKKMIKDIVDPKHGDFIDIVSAEVHLDDLEQHGRMDSLRVSGIPEPEEHDDTDAAVMSVCTAMKLDPPLDPKDIAISNRVGRKVQGKDWQVIVKFATRNVRERVFRAWKSLKDVNQDKDVGKISMKIWWNSGPTRQARHAPTRLLVWSMIHGQYMKKSWPKTTTGMYQWSEHTRTWWSPESRETEDTGGRLVDKGVLLMDGQVLTLISLWPSDAILWPQHIV